MQQITVLELICHKTEGLGGFIVECPDPVDHIDAAGAIQEFGSRLQFQNQILRKMP